jgi:squalene-associated FAD-dependent desaturase
LAKDATGRASIGEPQVELREVGADGDMSDSRPRVAVIGGGLAGLSAALALAENGCAVELFEAKRNLGGRAGSFVDKATGETIDHCQHVAMGCCTNYLDFCRRVGAYESLRILRRLNFIGPLGERCQFRPSSWLPAPLHLSAGLRRLWYLSRFERRSIKRALANLARMDGDLTNITMRDWLRSEEQTPESIEFFWSVVLESALGDDIKRASLAAARKVFVDGFMASRRAYELYVPTVPLATIYDKFVSRKLTSLGVTIHLESPIERIIGSSAGVRVLRLRDGTERSFDHYVVAAAWRAIGGMFDEEVAASMPWLARLSQLPTSPVSAVHLWFDRPITKLDHAVLVGGLSQWLFNRGVVISDDPDRNWTYYYQVVISGPRGIVGGSQKRIVHLVCDELFDAFWTEAEVVHSRVIADRDAVFAPTPEWESLRPPQTTPVPNLFLCGDWTATGWPATMEGAVRSGRLAAEGLLTSLGRNFTKNRLVTPDLPRGWLARWLIR